MVLKFWLLIFIYTKKGNCKLLFIWMQAYPLLRLNLFVTLRQSDSSVDGKNGELLSRNLQQIPRDEKSVVLYTATVYNQWQHFFAKSFFQALGIPFPLQSMLQPWRLWLKCTCSCSSTLIAGERELYWGTLSLIVWKLR